MSRKHSGQARLQTTRAQNARVQNARVQTSWDDVADWYDGWVGAQGSHHHRYLAIPTVLEMLSPRPSEKILDIGAGQGVLAPYIARAGAHYVGVDASLKLLRYARKHHARCGEFILGDARRLSELPSIAEAAFDGAVFLLSIQDMEPLQRVIGGAAWALRPGGRLVVLMRHPCFRIPRQSGWGWDEKRKLQYRRIDRYLTTYRLTEKVHLGSRTGTTQNFHRPLGDYLNALAECGLALERVREITNDRLPSSKHRSPEAPTNSEIPLFLCLRARKVKGWTATQAAAANDATAQL